MYNAYCRVFSRCGLSYKIVLAESGVIGGEVSHEFLIPADSGEEKFLVCPACDFGTTQEEAKCPNCGDSLEEKRGIEVGHIFQLGTKYSESMKAYFVDKDGEEKPLIMGCYGIGIGRTMAAAIEACHDEKGIQWPLSISPYEVVIIPVNWRKAEQRKAAEEIYQELKKRDFEVVIDDREFSAGYKFSEADLIGFPLQVIVGEKMSQEGKIEIKVRQNNERWETKKEEVLTLLLKLKEELAPKV